MECLWKSVSLDYELQSSINKLLAPTENHISVKIAAFLRDENGDQLVSSLRYKYRFNVCSQAYTPESKSLHTNFGY